jgi:hypothetical protein
MGEILPVMVVLGPGGTRSDILSAYVQARILKREAGLTRSYIALANDQRHVEFGVEE